MDLIHKEMGSELLLSWQVKTQKNYNPCLGLGLFSVNSLEKPLENEMVHLRCLSSSFKINKPLLDSISG